MALRKIPAPARAAVLLLMLAVLLCLTLPMTSGDMGGSQLAAMFCCFVLAIVLSVLLLARPRTALLWAAPVRWRPVPARGDPRVRAPDLSILGILLV
jgi:hypothetical protein